MVLLDCPTCGEFRAIRHPVDLVYERECDHCYTARMWATNQPEAPPDARAPNRQPPDGSGITIVGKDGSILAD